MMQATQQQSAPSSSNKLLDKKMMAVIASAALATSMITHKSSSKKQDKTKHSQQLRCINDQPKREDTIDVQKNNLFRMNITICEELVFESFALVDENLHLMVMNQQLYDALNLATTATEADEKQIKELCMYDMFTLPPTMAKIQTGHDLFTLDLTENLSITQCPDNIIKIQFSEWK